MRYLVRFLEKDDYVRQLLAGQLNMFRLGKYRSEFQMGRRDSCEGNIGKNEAAYLDCPVYCLSLFESESNDVPVTLNVSRNALYDFCKCGGYAVVFPFDTFCDHMNSLGSRVEHRAVEYYEKDRFSSFNLSQAAFAKRDKYRYQSEYRFLLMDCAETCYVCERDRFCEPIKRCIPRFTEKVYVIELPPVCQIAGNSFPLKLNSESAVTNGDWHLRVDAK